jgi:hypothetical protein
LLDVFERRQKALEGTGLRVPMDEALWYVFHHMLIGLHDPSERLVTRILETVQKKLVTYSTYSRMKAIRKCCTCNVAMSMVNVGRQVNADEMQNDFKDLNHKLDNVMWKFRVRLTDSISALRSYVYA